MSVGKREIFRQMDDDDRKRRAAVRRDLRQALGRQPTQREIDEEISVRETYGD